MSLSILQLVGRLEVRACGDAVMRAGRHFAEFTITQNTGTPVIGVVPADFDPTDGGEAQDQCPSAVYWAADSAAYISEWDDQADIGRKLRFNPPPDYADGTVAGLLLDLTVGSLVLYLDGERAGVLIGRGIEGPVKWVIDITVYVYPDAG